MQLQAYMAKHKSRSKKHKSIPKVAAIEEKSFLDIKVVIGILVVSVFATYAMVWGNDFVWDDDPYITLNDAVKTFDLGALLGDFHVGNYHPLTMLSLAIEYAIVGEKPWLYHLNNILLHIANSYLVFSILIRLKLKDYIAFFTALFFAIHPLHVESVAWAAERKDVLYTLFLLLSFSYYLKYTGSKSKLQFALSLLLFVASCLSKGMAVVLPALLIITDWWFLGKKLSVRNLIDKAPYFAITLFFAWLATTAQKEAGADATSVISAAYDSWERVRIVAYSFMFYWVKTLLPLDLLPFYPYPSKATGSIPGIFNMAFVSVLIFLAGAFFLGLKNKKVWWGVAFFIIAISTVLQILPVGSAIVADRYYYLSSIGPLFLLVYAIYKWVPQKKTATIVLSVIGLAFGAKTFEQVTHWENLYSLFTPAEEKHPEDSMIISNLGWYYLGEEKYQEAKAYLIRADNNGFKNADVCRTIGSMFIDEGNFQAAQPYIERAFQYRPVKPRTDWLMALVFSKQGQFQESLPFAEKAYNQDPSNTEYQSTYASILTELGQTNKARAIYQELAKEETPDDLLNISFTYKKAGDVETEIQLLKELLLKYPDYLPAYRNLGISLSELGRNEETVTLWEKAAAIDPSGDYEYNIGINYASRNMIDKAIGYYQRAARKGKKEAIDLLNQNGSSF